MCICIEYIYIYIYAYINILARINITNRESDPRGGSSSNADNQSGDVQPTI